MADLESILYRERKALCTVSCSLYWPVFSWSEG